MHACIVAGWITHGAGGGVLKYPWASKIACSLEGENFFDESEWL